MIKQLKTTQLFPHPDNRPLGINQEKVEQLAEMMKANGYDESKPIKARPFEGAYQIIEGEHRWRAAQKGGVETVPVFVIEVDDDEALIQLVAGNAQTESHALDYGYAALKVCKEHSKKGMSYAEFAARVGLSKDALSRATKSAKVRSYIEQCRPGATLLTETKKLNEIYKCRQSDWLWFHDLVINKELSKNDCIEISKRIRAIDDIAKSAAVTVLDLTELKQEIATAKERVFNERLSLIEGIEDCAGQLDERWVLYRYDVLKDEVVEYTHNARESFLSRLSNQKELTRQIVFSIYKIEKDKKRQQTKASAEADAEHYRDKANKEDAEELARAEWEAFMPEQGKWYQVGQHRLYCGDNRDKAFIDGLPEKVALVFADPPYNEDVAEWDNDFTWQQDYLQDVADYVVVTPGISMIQSFLSATKMSYKWSLSAWISNGMTRGALGFGNWMYAALFSKLESVHLNAQDFKKINIKTSENEGHYHKGRKPSEYMDWILGLFCKEGQSVVDPFLGSGSTLLQCEKNGLVCYGAEISPEYCKKIMEQHKAIIDADIV
jgi:ParB/RepB/Spo0J family partition protein